MDERHVVTVFLEHQGLVALFRRSNAVSTYQGRWAGISGSVEAGGDPQAQMWQEVAEETGLGREDVELLCWGAPLEVYDRRLDRKWVVHPFLLAVKDRTKMRLDWEHSEMKWVPPETIPAYPTVPQLWETWLRVRPVQEHSRGGGR